MCQTFTEIIDLLNLRFELYFSFNFNFHKRQFIVGTTYEIIHSPSNTKYDMNSEQSVPTEFFFYITCDITKDHLFITCTGLQGVHVDRKMLSRHNCKN